MYVTVQDIMTENVVSIGPNTTVEEAADLLLRHAISGLPVIDEHECLLGMISEFDLLKNFLSDEPASLPVSKYMTREVQSVKPSESAADVGKKFLAGRHRRFPVCDHGRLLGIVSRRDVLRLIETARSLHDNLATTVV